jgi:hypothetical protein
MRPQTKYSSDPKGLFFLGLNASHGCEVLKIALSVVEWAVFCLPAFGGV